MKVTIYIILLFLIGGAWLQGQERYTIKRANFSSDRYDEFSPVITGSKLVFCSNQDAGLFITYMNKDKKSLFKILQFRLAIQHDTPDLYSSVVILALRLTMDRFHLILQAGKQSIQEI